MSAVNRAASISNAADVLLFSYENGAHRSVMSNANSSATLGKADDNTSSDYQLYPKQHRRFNSQITPVNYSKDLKPNGSASKSFRKVVTFAD